MSKKIYNGVNSFIWVKENESEWNDKYIDVIIQEEFYDNEYNTVKIELDKDDVRKLINMLIETL